MHSRRNLEGDTIAVSTTTVVKTFLGSYPHTQALKDGTIEIPGVELELVEVEPVSVGFGAMADRLAFDVAEMAISTYLLARSFDKPITALPVIVFRSFQLGRIYYNVRSGIREPKDLEGRRVGIRMYTQTMPLWSRGVLQHEYGVDLDSINWVTFEGANVRSYTDPPNVERAPVGKKMGQMLLDGDIDAMFGPVTSDSPDIKCLFPNASEIEAAWVKKHGVYPFNHLITIRNDVVERNPGILEQLFAAFKQAKQAYLQRLAGTGPFSAADEDMIRLTSIMGDALPYGIAPNRKAIEMAAQLSYEQHFVPRLYTVEELFRPEVLWLEG